MRLGQRDQGIAAAKEIAQTVSHLGNKYGAADATYAADAAYAAYAYATDAAAYAAYADAAYVAAAADADAYARKAEREQQRQDIIAAFPPVALV